MCVGLWLVWTAGWWSKVVISDSGVVANNLFIEYVIPWKSFGGFVVASGLCVEIKGQDRRVSLFQFGGSLLGAMTNYRGISQVQARMMKASAEFSRPTGQNGHGTFVRRVRIPWWPLVLYLLPLELVAIFVDAAKHTL